MNYSKVWRHKICWGHNCLLVGLSSSIQCIMNGNKTGIYKAQQYKQVKWFKQGKDGGGLFQFHARYRIQFFQYFSHFLVTCLREKVICSMIDCIISINSEIIGESWLDHFLVIVFLLADNSMCRMTVPGSNQGFCGYMTCAQTICRMTVIGCIKQC